MSSILVTPSLLELLKRSGEEGISANGTVPFSDVSRAVDRLREQGEEDLHLWQAVRGSEPVPEPPPSRPPRTPEMEERLRLLRANAEEREYQEMLSSCFPNKREKSADNEWATGLKQSGLVLDLVIVVFGGALAGYFIARQAYLSEVWRWTAAAAGAVLGLIVDSLLMMFRLSRMDRRDASRREPPVSHRPPVESKPSPPSVPAGSGGGQPSRRRRGRGR